MPNGISHTDFPGAPKIAGKAQPATATGMTDDLTLIILAAIERAPQWIRRDLESKDHVVRVQAEESLATILAEAIRKANEASD